LASADRLLLPRDVGGDAVGVTSVLPVVTSGRDVLGGGHLEVGGATAGASHITACIELIKILALRAAFVISKPIP
jgi:hypothetical protein